MAERREVQILLYPPVLILGLLLPAAIGCFVAAWRTEARCARLILIPLGLLFLVPHGIFVVILKPELVDSRVRTYKTFYKQIEIGMTRQDVLATMSRCYPGNGLRARPTLMEDAAERIGFFMNPEDSAEPNCEGIFLRLKDEKIIEKTYSPD